ncbi:transcriptional regulator [Pedobacter sp. HMWF019]|nr:transcriptional regulator [Pedobacter sp. HMWF019]
MVNPVDLAFLFFHLYCKLLYSNLQQQSFGSANLQNCKPMRKISSTNFRNEQILHELCDAAFTLSVLGGRWKLTILVKLLEGSKRFSDLKATIPAITERVLALQLKSLEKNGLIEKFIDSDKLPFYTTTNLAQSLEPVIYSLSSWGKMNRPNPPSSEL